MPDLTVETILMCPQWASNWQVLSSKGVGKYLVQFNPMMGTATCNCPAYQFSGDYGSQFCKHIQKVKDHGCFYDAYTGEAAGPNDWAEHGIELLSTSPEATVSTCPGCSKPMITIQIAV